MKSTAASASKILLRLSAVLLVSASAGACSSMGWADPTNWIGGDSQASNAPDDQSAADNGQTPDLSTIPDKPNAPSTADDQKEVSDTLAADRSGAQYSSNSLKGGTEAAAEPPPATPPPSAAEDVANNESSPTGAPPPSGPSAQQTASTEQPATSAAPGTLPSTPDAADNNASPATAATTPAAPTTQVAMAEPPPAVAALPAVPAVPAAVAQQQTVSDNSLGFHRSSAPPLDASVSQFVPQPILARYQQTAPIGPAPAVAATTPANTYAVAGLPSAYAPGTGPAAVVFFPHDTTILNGAAKAQVQAAARIFLDHGGQGYVRVVGHASSHGAALAQSRHLVWNFERSQARANAVARELIRAGVPAAKVLVETAGDTQPVYNESTPQGEDGSRSAEIFIQG